MAGEGSTPGNGSTSPFGNGDGATQSAGSISKGTDFLTDPQGQSRVAGGRDFTGENRPQKGRADGFNPSSVPAGGRLPFVDPKAREGATLQPVGAAKKPYRLGGEGGAQRGEAPMKLQGGNAPAEAGSVPGDEVEG
jgi:hypothetical protein